MPFCSTDDNEERKRKKAEYNRAYRLKRKIQQEQLSNEEDAERKRKKAEANRAYRLKQKIEREQRSNEDIETQHEPPQKKFISECVMANVEFRKRIHNNQFGLVCSACDRLWFERDLRPVPDRSTALLREEFPNEETTTARQVYETCYRSLIDNKMPRLSKSNGFAYPEYPSHLPPLDITSE
jgi:hypothetical protein